MQHHVHLLNGSRAEAPVEAVAVEALDVGRREGFELHPPQGGCYVQPNKLFVALVGRVPHRVLDRVLEPPVEILLDGETLIVEDEALLAVRERPGELLRHLCPRLAVDSLPLTSLCRMHNVLGHPAPVLTAMDGPLAVSSFPAHYFTPLFRSLGLSISITFQNGNA